MTELPLFEVPDPDPGQEDQSCDRCLHEVLASDDRLRVLGWDVYDGTSETGRQLHVRICPTCRRRESKA